MRIDCRDDRANCHKYRTFLDGVELPLCFMSDDEEGVALCFATDEFGRRHAYWPGRTQPLQHRVIDGVLYREVQSDPYSECVVEVRGNIEIRKVAA